MGVAVPLTVFFLLGLRTPGQFFTVAATTFLAWGVSDFLASILEKPRLENRSPQSPLSSQHWQRQIFSRLI